MNKVIYTLAAIGLTASAAYAQPGLDPVQNEATAQTPSDAAPAAEAVPAPSPEAAADGAVAPDAADTATTNYADTEIDSFAKATVKVNQIDADTTLSAEQKQTQMAAAVTEVGLDPLKYNEISEAVTADPELRAKVELAISQATQPSG